MDINTEKLDLATVYENLNITDIISYHEELLTIKNDLNHCLSLLREDSTDIDERLSEIIDIEEQMICLDANIKVLVDAILAHESKVIEKRTTLGSLGLFNLN